MPTKPLEQRHFVFVERPRRHERWFKIGLVGATCLAIFAFLAALPRGSYFVRSMPGLARRTARRVLGRPTPRFEIDEEWRRYRVQGVADSIQSGRRFYDEADRSLKRLFDYAGLDPDRAVHRWGNYTRTLLLPGKVFEEDDNGRSYRLKPHTKSIWLRGLTLKAGVLMFFLVPYGPGLADAIRGTSAIPIAESVQSTNSWGLRGPEPEVNAPLRVMVLGDSFMQGLYIGDGDTPPERLRRYLCTELNEPVSVLNTGLMGYSPEQYYFSLVAFAERFQPHFIVTSYFANDFGTVGDVTNGLGDWDEGKYWLDKIAAYCQTRNLPFLLVSVPLAEHMKGRRRTGNYPGMLVNTLEINSANLFNPLDRFVDANLSLVVAGLRNGQPPSGIPLFNEKHQDGHFSAIGSEVWAEAVGRRVVLLLRRQEAVQTARLNSLARFRQGEAPSEPRRERARLPRITKPHLATVKD
jgi:hypothetical protein